MEPEIETVPCKICGRPTRMLGTTLCNDCYEIDSRLSGLAKNPQARAYLRAKLGPEPLLDDWTIRNEPPARTRMARWIGLLAL